MKNSVLEAFGILGHSDLNKFRIIEAESNLFGRCIVKLAVSYSLVFYPW